MAEGDVRRHRNLKEQPKLEEYYRGAVGLCRANGAVHPPYNALIDKE